MKKLKPNSNSLHLTPAEKMQYIEAVVGREFKQIFEVAAATTYLCRVVANLKPQQIGFHYDTGVKDVNTYGQYAVNWMRSNPDFKTKLEQCRTEIFEVLHGEKMYKYKQLTPPLTVRVPVNVDLFGMGLKN